MARLVFFGTPALAVPTLETLHDAGHEIVLVVSQADKRRGRGAQLQPSPVKQAAIDRNLTTTSRVRDVLDVQADAGVLVAFGRLIRPEILSRFPIVNLHPSLLPRWRGATPVEAAILAGDDTTGICLMRLVEEMDAGPVHRSWQTTIQPREHADVLYQRLFAQGNAMLVDMLAGPWPEPVPQTGEPTYCGKLTPADFEIDWTGAAVDVERRTRVGVPWTTFRGRRLRVFDAHAESVSETLESAAPGTLDGTRVRTGDGMAVLTRVQPEAKGAMDATAWINGARPHPGERLG